jgi:outer membrane protein TolC
VALVPLSVPEVHPGLSREAAVARALARRREIAALDSAVQRLRRADKRLRKEAVAPVLLGAEGEAQGNEQTNSSVGASVAFELPFIYRNQAERAVARGQADALVVDRELTERAIGRQAALAFDRLETALAEFAALDQQATEAARRTLEMTNLMLEAGAVDYFRLLSARRSAYELRARRVNSLRAAWLSRIALERAVGGMEQAP